MQMSRIPVLGICSLQSANVIHCSHTPQSTFTHERLLRFYLCNVNVTWRPSYTCQRNCSLCDCLLTTNNYRDVIWTSIDLCHSNSDASLEGSSGRIQEQHILHSGYQIWNYNKVEPLGCSPVACLLSSWPSSSSKALSKLISCRVMSLPSSSLSALDNKKRYNEEHQL